MYFLLFTFFFLAACQSPGPNPADTTPTLLPPTPSATPVPAPVVARIDLIRPPETLDPALVAPPSADATGNDLVENLFIGLTRLDGDSGQVEPALAKSWDTSANGLTWTFYLRDDTFWVRINTETGQMERVRPVTAADVVYAVRRACRSDTPTSLGNYPGIYVIQGCRQVKESDPSQLTDEIVVQTVGVRVLNDTTVEFTLAANAATFPAILAMPVMRPVPADLVDSAGEGWAQPDQIWTSGPFVVQPDSPPEQGITLIANSFWPIERTGNVEVVQVSFGAEQVNDLALRVIQQDEIAAAPFDDDPSYRLLALPVTTFLVASYDTPPLDNADVRRALSLALDRQALLDETLKPAGVIGLPALTITPPGSADAPPYGEVGVSYDADAARAALASAGYENCARLPQITLLTDDTEFSTLLGSRLVELWTEVFGCPEGVFQLEQQSGYDVQAILREPPPERQPRRAGLILLNWQADNPTTQHWLADIFACRQFFPDAYVNQARNCTEADQALTGAASTLDGGLRAALYQSIEAAFFGPQGEMPVIPIYFHARGLVMQPWVEVYPLHAGPLRFDQWVVDQSLAP